MGPNEKTKGPQPAHGTAAAEAGDRYTPRNLTFAQNVVLTIKVLADAGLLIASLWGLTLWTSAD